MSCLGEIDIQRLPNHITEWSLGVERLTSEIESINPYESTESYKKVKRLQAAREVMNDQKADGICFGEPYFTSMLSKLLAINAKTKAKEDN